MITLRPLSFTHGSLLLWAKLKIWAGSGTIRLEKFASSNTTEVDPVTAIIFSTHSCANLAEGAKARKEVSTHKGIENIIVDTVLKRKEI